MNTFSYTSRWVARSASSRPQIRCPAFLAGKYNVCAWSASPSRLQESRAAPLDSAGPAVEDATPSSTAGSLDSSGPSEVAGNETSDVATQAATTPGSELAATVDDDAAVLAEVLRSVWCCALQANTAHAPSSSGHFLRSQSHPANYDLAQPMARLMKRWRTFSATSLMQLTGQSLLQGGDTSCLRLSLTFTAAAHLLHCGTRRWGPKEARSRRPKMA